jgi:hypothetical protein
MKRVIWAATVFALSVVVTCMSLVTKSIAATPTAVVIVMCGDYGAWPVMFYDHSANAPTQTSGASCPAQLASLLASGFINVNVTTQTYETTTVESIGAPGGVDGTYSTYVLMSGALASGNL